MNDVEYDSFYKTIDRKFWDVINKNRLVEDERNRTDVLSPLYKRLASHEYFPSIPTALIEQNKGLGVVRQIPIFSPEDYCVYYFCVKYFEKIFSKRRIDGTFGGWSMGGRIRKMEEGLPQDDEGYQLTFSYNPVAWARYYGEFNGRLNEVINDLKAAKKNDYVA